MTGSKDISDLRALARALDSRFEGPFGWRFGWDGLIGMIPVVGDLITNAIAFYIIFRAGMIGCPPTVIGRMGLNLVFENLIDAIPIFGNFFDFVWKANQMNVALAEGYLSDPVRTTRSSRLLLGLIILSILMALIASLVLTILAIRWALQLFRQSLA